MNTLAWSPPTAFANKLGPGGGGGEDVADALGVASESAKRHVAVFGRQDHVLDGGHFGGGELARARTRARRPVGEFANCFGSPPSVVPPRFQSEDAQDYGQGKERFGAGDGTKNTGFRLALGKAHPGKTEPRSTKQGEQQTNNSGERSRPLLPAYAGIEGVLLLLVERFRRDDRAEAASSPGGSGGAWNLDVTGDDLGATTNDLFAKAMVIGPACPRQDCCD
jgi:hypothetical protein